MPETGAGHDLAGRLVAVVGPSGAGKDSLIAHARELLSGDARFCFVRRVITRPPDGGSEDHVPMSEEAFEQALARGAFVADWQAHGLRYGIPAAAGMHVRNGGVAVFNGSRAALPAVRRAFPELAVIHVTAEPGVLAARLAARGRETAGDIEARLARAVDDYPGRETAITIDNSGTLARAGAEIVAALLGLAGDNRPAAS